MSIVSCLLYCVLFWSFVFVDIVPITPWLTVVFWIIVCLRCVLVMSYYCVTFHGSAMSTGSQDYLELPCVKRNYSQDVLCVFNLSSGLKGQVREAWQMLFSGTVSSLSNNVSHFKVLVMLLWTWTNMVLTRRGPLCIMPLEPYALWRVCPMDIPIVTDGFVVLNGW